VDANLEQVKKGMAWVYKQYASDPAYFEAEDEAKKAKVGLWSQPNPTPPWEFRHGGKSKSFGDSDLKKYDKKTKSKGSFQCAGKTKCGEMDSCDEAMFYLNNCGLSRLDNVNLPVIKKTYITRGLGWKEIDNKLIFLASKATENQIIDFIPEPGFERFAKALTPVGSYEKWKEASTLAIQMPVPNFAFYASFTPPLLNLLKAPNFIIDFWGLTSKGKTTTLELAASAWGNPHKESGGLVFGWDSTKVFHERIANFFCDMPIFPDDSHTLNDEKILTKILYMVANGVGRGRGSISGIRHTPFWRTVCLSTGEKSITECTTFGGAKARTISFHGYPFDNMHVDIINSIRNQLRENYGHAGPVFAKAITEKFRNQEEVEKLKKQYRKKQQEFSRMAPIELGDRIAHYFAAVDVAARLVNEILDINHEKAIDMIAQVFLDYVKDSDQDLDMPTRAMRHVLSWASGNERYFKSMDYESYGVWVEGEHIAICPFQQLTGVTKGVTRRNKA